MLKKVPLGRSGLSVSQLGLGANRLLEPSETEWVATVNEALDRGGARGGHSPQVADF